LHEDEQYLLFGIEIHELLYCVIMKIAGPHCSSICSDSASLWGDFNFSLNGILEMEIEEQLYLSPPSYGLWIPPQTVHQSTHIDCRTKVRKKG
jgi:hypothetical protein